MKTYTYRQLGEKMEEMGEHLPYVLLAHIMWNIRAEANDPPGWDDTAPYGVVKFCIGSAADE